MILLDTDIVSELIRLNQMVSKQAQDYVSMSGPLKTSIIIYYEILSGLLYKDARKQLSRFESIVTLSEVMHLTIQSVNISAQIEADLCRCGLSIGATDTLVAGVALANGLQLATNNTAHFNRIDGLQLVNWTL